MLLETNLKLRKKEKARNEFYVYYDEWDGSIKSISSKLKETIKYPHIVTSDPIAAELLLGHADIKKYIVTDLVDGTCLVKKEDLIHIRKAEDKLSKVPLVKDTVESDINIIIYHNPGLIEINVSKETVYKLTGRRFNKNIFKGANSSRSDIELYLIKNNNPLILIETIKIDPIDLINNGYIIYDISHLKLKLGLADIGVLTKRIFKKYGLKVKNKYLSADYHKRKSIKRTFFNSKKNKNESDLFTIYKKNKNWVFKRNIDNLFDLKIYNDIKFYVVDKTPNHLIDSFIILKNDIETLEEYTIPNIDYDLSKYTLMTNETGKNMTIRIEEPNE